MINYFGVHSRVSLLTTIKRGVAKLLAPVIILSAVEAIVPPQVQRAIDWVLRKHFDANARVIGLFKRSNGEHIVLISARGEKFIVRVSDAVGFRMSSEVSGLVNFAGIRGLCVAQCLAFEHLNGVDIMIETCLPTPTVHVLGVPSDVSLQSAWLEVIAARGTTGMIVDTNIVHDVIDHLCANLSEAPKWLAEWLAAKRWIDLSAAVGATPIGPIHGDLDKKNCWRLAGKLCIVDFERSLHVAPMAIDLIRWRLLGDFRANRWENRARDIVKNGMVGLDKFSHGLAVFNNNRAARIGLVFFTLLYELAWGVRSGLRFDQPEMRRFSVFMGELWKKVL